MQNVPLPLNHSSESLSSSVCNLICRHLIYVPTPAQGAQRSPLILPMHRIRSDGRPRPVRCYSMCSNACGLWCWDATTQAATDEARLQRRGRRPVLSCFFKVRAHQGRVTVPSKSVQGFRAPNSISAGPIPQGHRLCHCSHHSSPCTATPSHSMACTQIGFTTLAESACSRPPCPASPHTFRSRLSIL